MPKDVVLKVDLLEDQNVKLEPAPLPVQSMTFDVWFSSLGRPLHHKAGMRAFAPTEGRRTKSGWEALFKSY